MFEQSFVENSAGVRKPWSLAVSFTGQALILGIIVLIPILNTAAITFKAPEPIYLMPRKPAPVQEPEVAARRTAPNHAVRPSFVQPSVIHAPSRIPQVVAMIEEPPAPPGLLSGSATGSGSPDGILGGGLGAPTQLQLPRAPEKPAPSTPARVPVSSGVQAAKIVYQPKPIYPGPARTARIQGVVRLQAIISPDGHIRNLQVVSGSPLLVPSALESVKQWVYQPTLLNGAPVEVITQIDVNFTLSN